MIDKKKFMLRGALWILLITVLAMTGCWFAFGKVIEGTLFAELAKWGIMTIVIAAILETLWYAVGMVLYHWADDYKTLYGKGWFWKGIKNDLKYIKDNWSWKKFLKVVLAYVVFFAVFGLIIFLVG